MLNLIGQRVGQYEILSLLGRGGMATVYRARQASMGREVAIKVILPAQEDPGDLARRFAREVRIVASLSHPHIIKVFDYGEQGDLLYLVMELLKGGNLANMMREGPLPQDTIVRILEQIASALDYAHSLDIIHRDLKPQNVLLDAHTNVHLTDFGLAKILDQETSLSDSGMARGTPAYMSPEQWMSDPVDARTDIYCLGIMLYQMLSGELPFNARTPYGMLQMHVNEPPPSISSLRADLPVSVNGVIYQALAKSPEDRYQSAKELVEDLKLALEAQTPPTTRNIPVVRDGSANLSANRRTSIGEPTRRLVPTIRRRLLFVAGLILMLMILIGGGAIALSRQGGGLSATQTPMINSLLPSPTTDTVAELPASETKSPNATGTPSQTPNIQTRAAETFAARPTLTANALGSLSPAANDQQTLDAIVNQTDTAVAMASFTKTPTPTITPTVTASPTLTLTLTLSVTPTPTDVPCMVYVSGQGDQQLANVRSGPGTNYPIYGTITPKDGKFKVTGQFVDASQNVWWQIQYTEKLLGFVSAAFVSTEGSTCKDSPRVTAPPPPPKTAASTPTPSSNPGGSGGSNGSGSSGGSTPTQPSILPTLPLSLTLSSMISGQAPNN